MKRYKATLIGNGVMGNRHKNRFEFCGVSFLHVVDLDTADFFAADAENVDFVVIATPASTHYNYVKYFLEKRIPVFVEKPLAVNAAKAQELVDLAKRNNTILFVAQSECFNPLFLNFRKHFVAELKQNANARLEFRREHRYSNRCRDVNVALDLLVHDLCIFFMTFRYEDVKIVNFEQINKNDNLMQNYDEAHLRLFVEKGEFAGVTADFYVNRNSDRDVRTIDVEMGRKGDIPAVSYSTSLIKYLPNGEIAHVADSLENEHKFFMKLLAGACTEWGLRAAQNAADAVKIVTYN